MSWQSVLGGGLLAAYAGISAVLCRLDGAAHVLLSAVAGGCLGFGLLFALRGARAE